MILDSCCAPPALCSQSDLLHRSFADEFKLGAMQMDLAHADKMFNALSDIIDLPLYEESPRVVLSATLAVSSLQFAMATRSLCASGLILGAAATLRSQFEALIRSAWVLHRATETQIERLTATLNQESQQASKNIPLAHEMLTELEKFPQLANLVTSLKEFKESSWLPLNSFVHSGIHAVHWTRNQVSPKLLDQIFKSSNGLSVIAFQGIGILTGRLGIQSEIIAATAAFSSCLPPHRVVT